MKVKSFSMMAERAPGRSVFVDVLQMLKLLDTPFTIPVAFASQKLDHHVVRENQVWCLGKDQIVQD